MKFRVFIITVIAALSLNSKLHSSAAAGGEQEQAPHIAKSSLMLPSVIDKVWNLSNKGLDDKGLNVVVGYLKTNHKVQIRQIDLSHNNFTFNGLRSLVPWLPDNLTYFNASHNNLNDNSAKLIINQLGKALVTLNLSYNNLTDDTSDHLIKSFGRHKFTGLRNLDLSGNEFSPTGIDALTASKPANLEKFILDDPKMLHFQLRHIDALSFGKTIITLIVFIFMVHIL